MSNCDEIKRLADKVRPQLIEIGPVEVRRRVAVGALLIDVRDEDELLRNPPLAGAVNLSRGRLEYLIVDAVSSKDAPIILYCGGGARSALAAASLQALGYTQVYVLAGGLKAWRSDAGQPWVSVATYTGSSDLRAAC